MFIRACWLAGDATAMIWWCWWYSLQEMKLWWSVNWLNKLMMIKTNSFIKQDELLWFYIPFYQIMYNFSDIYLWFFRCPDTFTHQSCAVFEYNFLFYSIFDYIFLLPFLQYDVNGIMRMIIMGFFSFIKYKFNNFHKILKILIGADRERCFYLYFKTVGGRQVPVLCLCLPFPLFWSRV